MLVSIRYSPDGVHVSSWGEPGGGPGEFRIPHGIAVGPDGTVVVADRENSRLQFFSPDGEFLEEWTDVARPCQVLVDARGHVYVAELGYRAGMWPGTTAPGPDATGGRVSVFDHDGRLLARWGAARTRVPPATSSRPMTSASIRGATSTSAR